LLLATPGVAPGGVGISLTLKNQVCNDCWTILGTPSLTGEYYKLSVNTPTSVDTNHNPQGAPYLLLQHQEVRLVV
jgi:hypothetical protein